MGGCDALMYSACMHARVDGWDNGIMSDQIVEVDVERERARGRQRKRETRQEKERKTDR